MKKVLKFGLLGILGLLGLIKTVSAATYPIPELGNCASKQECFYYCEIPANKPACWSYDQFVLGKQVLGDATTSAAREQEIRTHGVTFPIPELGNCANITECKAFCDKTENRTTCQSFAQSHGITKPFPTPIDQQTLLAKAKEILGCNSIEECKAFCSVVDNREKCQSLARSVGIQPEPTRQVPPDIFDAAQRDLGCDSLTSCKEVCSKQENFQKCQDFAQKHNLGERKTENTKPVQTNEIKPLPSGVSSLDSPTSTTSDLYQKLHDSTGCNSTVECYTYCVAHPDSCPGFPKEFYAQPTKSLSPYPTYYPTGTAGGNPAPTTCPVRYNYPGCTWIIGSNCNEAKLVCTTLAPSPSNSTSPGSTSSIFPTAVISPAAASH